MGSRHKKALIAESVRESLHSWCKRVKERSRRDALLSVTTRSTCSLESTIDERDEIITVASGTLSPCSSSGSLNHQDLNEESAMQPDCDIEDSNPPHNDISFRISEYLSQTIASGAEENADELEEHHQPETLFDLFQKT